MLIFTCKWIELKAALLLNKPEHRNTNILDSPSYVEIKTSWSRLQVMSSIRGKQKKKEREQLDSKYQTQQGRVPRSPVPQHSKGNSIWPEVFCAFWSTRAEGTVGSEQQERRWASWLTDMIPYWSLLCAHKNVQVLHVNKNWKWSTQKDFQANARRFILFIQVSDISISNAGSQSWGK